MTNKLPVTDASLARFIDGAQKIIDVSYAQSVMHPKLVTRKGKKYIKVIKKDYEADQHGSVYAFIDASTGDIYRPASHAAPAKHVRGNLNAPDHGVNCAGPYGIAYLR